MKKILTSALVVMSVVCGYAQTESSIHITGGGYGNGLGYSDSYPTITSRTVKDSGYRGFVSVGYGYSSTDGVLTGRYHGYDFYEETSEIYIETTHGYQFNKNIFLGAGTGFCITTGGYDDYGDPWTYASFPVYVDFRLQANPSRCIPFFDFKTGVVLSAKTDFETPTYTFNPSIGLSFPIRNITTDISVGYKCSVGEYEDEWYGGTLTTHTLMCTVGISF